MNRTVELFLVKDSSHNDMLGVIPSTYDLCRMYDHNSVQFSITSQEDIELQSYKVFVRYIADNFDLGMVEVEPTEILDDNDEVIGVEYVTQVSGYYTRKSKLDIQIILIDEEHNESRTNIVTFRLGNSLPKNKKFFQNLSYLNKLVYDRKLKLSVEEEFELLIISDDLGNELCSIDIGYMMMRGDTIC